LTILATQLSESEALLMPREDRSRYFSLSREEKFLEWMHCKATVIVPVTQDLSTRIFDALLAGQVLIVPESIVDFDSVIPVKIQEQLGILRVPNLDLETVQHAAQEAFRRFDSMGWEGALFRHRYVLENHMLVNRVTAMLEMVWRLGTGDLGVRFFNGHAGYALYQVPHAPPISGAVVCR
jgi:hypothetical protein